MLCVRYCELFGIVYWYMVKFLLYFHIDKLILFNINQDAFLNILYFLIQNFRYPFYIIREFIHNDKYNTNNASFNSTRRYFTFEKV